MKEVSAISRLSYITKLTDGFLKTNDSLCICHICHQELWVGILIFPGLIFLLLSLIIVIYTRWNTQYLTSLLFSRFDGKTEKAKES